MFDEYFKSTLRVLTLVIFALGGAYGQMIPLDSAVRTGRLTNGFTYYIRHNGQPKNRVELYLINKVGSVVEDDDQQGLAHFMEHMNFNGTSNFPKNDLVDYLQKAGVRFGADLNAYTSFDETVYQLPIPTDDPEMLTKGLMIMRDWAQEATLDSAEIEKERGVILEEERLGKGAKDRMSRQYLPMLLNYTRYADRLPIGKDEVLIGFKPEVLKRFHRDWYRPNLQALIVVGDVDPDEAERLIKDKFGDLKNPENERERPLYTIPLNGKSQFMVVTDKEETNTGIEIMMKHRTRGMVTEQDYLARIKRNLLNQMIANRRYSEASREADPAYSGLNISIAAFLNDVDMLSLAVSAKDTLLEKSFKQGWRILERIKRHGFTETELKRAKQNQLRSLQSLVNEKGKTASVNYVKEYQNHFLHREASPGIEWEHRFTKASIDQIKIEDVMILLNEYLNSKDVNVLVSAPEKNKGYLPDSAAVRSWIASLSGEELNPYRDEQLSKPLLLKKPMPGKVIKKEKIPQLNITKLTLSNGVKVVLKPTDFKNDQVLYGAFSPGGTSLYDSTDFDVASNAAGIIARMGLANLDPVELNNMLTGKIASSATNLTMRSQTVRGSASPEDLETALQLTYLQFTAPAKDTLIFRNTMSNAIASLANRYASPANVFADTISFVLGNYNYRSAAPNAERLKKITLEKACTIYKDRFSDASGFTFVFTGNFKTEEISPLLLQYLGSLPSTFKREKARDLNIHIPEGVIVKKVYKGSEDKALVRMVFSGNYKYSPLANLQLNALGEILQIKVLQQLREAESEVYSSQVQTSYTKYPRNRFSINLAFGCAPKNADRLVNLVEQEFHTLKDNGPDPDDVRKFKAQYSKNLDLALKDNNFWLGYLLGQYENLEDPLQILEMRKNLDKISAASLKKAGQTFLAGKNEIIFDLLPESGAANNNVW